MDGPSPLRPPLEAARNSPSALIQAVYHITLEPQAYDEFMELWSDHVEAALAKLSDLQAQTDLTDPEIAGHFATAFAILEELGRRSAEKPRSGRGPRMLVDGAGWVVWFNGAAAERFGLGRTARLDDLAPFLRDPEADAERLAALAAAQPNGARQLLRLADGAHLIARPIVERDGTRLTLIEPLMPDWSDEAETMLRSSFGLSATETAVSRALAEGRTVAEIAAERGVSVLTVRTQIKHILAKTGVAGQSDLIRLVLAILRAVDQEMPAPLLLAESGRSLRARSGRDIPVAFYGPRTGRPVLFLHGMLDGCDTTPAIDEALDRHRLRLIAPVRPGFGTAPLDDAPIADAPDRLAADIETLLDSLRIEATVLLGHMAGAVYAFAAAARLGGRVRGLVNVSGAVPITSTDQFATMSRRQRLVAYTARYAPGALAFVLRAGIRQLDHDGERAFMTALYERSPPDLAAIADPAVFDTIRRGYRFTVAQGHRAFEIDSYHVVRDWSASVARSTAPVALLHGRDDPVVSCASVEGFARRLGPRATLEVIEGCGQLVLYTHPDRVAARLAAMLAAPLANPRRG